MLTGRPFLPASLNNKACIVERSGEKWTTSQHVVITISVGVLIRLSERERITLLMSAMKLTTSEENANELLDMSQLRNRHMLVRLPHMASLIRLPGSLLQAILNFM